MAYIINIQTGKGKNFCRTQSTPLSSKEKVRNWIRRNPLGNINSKITIKNTTTKKTITTTKAGGCMFGLDIKKNIRKRNRRNYMFNY